ncbi:hypothetical protein FW755_09325 [Lonepinella koalarum]|uniref:DUF1281 family ferredoxin-like fold protein n=1 Tax=Lonepinella koalarum TaxID=53417 RepID=UPI0011E43BCC|nr:hypothetical protein [Lonepinella koalarum]TYG35277.1 hypothetical protein FW755_09325 [Lonepinella koalarum]
MPNWCENKLEIFVSNTEQLQAVKAKLLALDEDQTQQLDFNLIIPMPESMKINCSSEGERSQILLETFPIQVLTHEHIEKFLHGCSVQQRQRIEALAFADVWTIADFIQWLSNNPEEQKACNLNLKLGQQYIDNLKQYGCTNWYDWACEYWGTKWNGQLCNIEEFNCHIIVHFDTAWTPPEPCFAELCKVFPEYFMVLSYYEQGC